MAFRMRSDYTDVSQMLISNSETLNSPEQVENGELLLKEFSFPWDL